MDAHAASTITTDQHEHDPFQREEMTAHRQHEMMGMNSYVAGGVEISLLQDAQEQCPKQLNSLIQCVLLDCPNPAGCPFLNGVFGGGRRGVLLRRPPAPTREEDQRQAVMILPPETLPVFVGTNNNNIPLVTTPLPESQTATQGPTAQVVMQEFGETFAPAPTPIPLSQTATLGPTAQVLTQAFGQTFAPAPTPLSQTATLGPTTQVVMQEFGETFAPAPTSVGSCTDIQNDLCETLSDNCCFQECANEFLDLTTCVITVKTGENRTDCRLEGECSSSPPISLENDNNTTTTMGGEDDDGAMPSPFLYLRGLEVDIFGTRFSSPLPIDACDFNWYWMLGCINEQCPTFAQDCTDPNVPPNANFSLVMEGASPQTCTELQTGFCEPLSSLPPSCCLSQCLLHLSALTTCVIQHNNPNKTIRECTPPCVVDWLVGPGLQLAGSAAPTIEDIGMFEFDFFGMNLTGIDAEEQCQNAKDKTMECVKQDCPNYFWSCTREIVEFPSGLYADPDALFVSNPNNKPLDLTPAEFGCANFTDAFCELFEVSSTCCLSKCMVPLYDMAACMIDNAIGNYSNLAGSCSAPQCITEYSNAYDPSSASFPVFVNSAFLISTMETITASTLMEQLQDGNNADLQVLLLAYRNFVQTVVDSLLGGSTGRQLGHLPASQDIRQRRLQARIPVVDPNSTEIYGFVDTPCNMTVVVPKQGGATEEACITVFGKYKLSVDPQSNPLVIYEIFQNETTAAIQAGVLQEKLEEASAEQGSNTGSNTPYESPFVVQGVSTVVDASFVAVGRLEASASDATTPVFGATNNTSLPTPTSPANSTDAPSDAAESSTTSWSSRYSILLAAIMLICSVMFL
ncbi:expressed unknown protein [Seminavis robusta]|uniref:Uncharacterized protein n=1 Tax=Seminavis robusta TaxID=568900 RepID=A0A9N8EGW5_9STRA|nr:expressed unknown protein [Seminavis robusta]|eukprot:Sro928_g221280.1 n/a (855) ;mRNA; r:37189-39753